MENLQKFWNQAYVHFLISDVLNCSDCNGIIKEINNNGLSDRAIDLGNTIQTFAENTALAAKLK